MNNTFKTSLQQPIQWLIRLRWLALGAQLVLSFFSIKFLNFEISYGFLALIFFLELFSNLYLVFLKSKKGQLSDTLVGCVLILDTFILYCLLYITGGPSNPFSIWFLLHIALSAVVLTPVWTWGLAAMSSVLFALLFFWHIPSSSHSMHMHGDGSFSLHLQGMLFAFILTALILTYFVTKVSKQLRNKEKQIFELEKERLNQLRLSSLSTLAARAAHELATPLSTISIAVGELDENVNDLSLIKSQVKRCQQVLDQIRGNSGELQGEFPKRINISQAIEESIVTLPPKLRAQVHFIKEKPKVRKEQLELLLPEESFKFSLLALIKNALDASSFEDTVSVDYKDLGSQVEISVSDSGKGMSLDVLEKSIDPFFTTKEQDSLAGVGGMGLGLFLANAFAQQNNGEFEIKSKQNAGTTARFLFSKA